MKRLLTVSVWSAWVCRFYLSLDKNDMYRTRKPFETRLPGRCRNHSRDQEHLKSRRHQPTSVSTCMCTEAPFAGQHTIIAADVAGSIQRDNVWLTNHRLPASMKPRPCFLYKHYWKIESIRPHYWRLRKTVIATCNARYLTILDTDKSSITIRTAEGFSRAKPSSELRSREALLLVYEDTMPAANVCVFLLRTVK